MNEKEMITATMLDQALKKQIVKRVDAPPPTPQKAAQNLAIISATEEGDFSDFFDTWDAYYPRIVSLLGWASWLLPGKVVTIIKSLLAVVNNQIIPILRQMAGK